MPTEDIERENNDWFNLDPGFHILGFIVLWLRVYGFGGLGFCCLGYTVYSLKQIYLP
jgi:hypothetical protein